MIITQSVYELINELCSSLHSDMQKELQFQKLSSKRLKSLKSRAFEILLFRKTSSTLHPHELYLHQFELTLNGECNQRMEDCCRLVEYDEYFKSEMGESILTFLLKLRNSVKSRHIDCVQDEKGLTNYFFNSSANQRDPYFFMPVEMLRFDERKSGLMNNFNSFTPGYPKVKNENSFFEFLVDSHSNGFIVSALKSPNIKQEFLYQPTIQLNNDPIIKRTESAVIRCARWDNLGQPMDYLDARFASEVGCTNELLVIATATAQGFEAKIIPLSQLMVDIKFLVTGIQSDSFHFDEKEMVFRMESNLTIENISPETMASSVVAFLECGSCYRRLQLLLSRNPIDFKYKFDGFVFKTMCNSVASFLIALSQFVNMFDDIFIAQLSMRMSSMFRNIEILSHILGVHPKSLIPMEKALAILPRGSEFLNYLYRKFVAFNQTDVAMLLFTILKECCTVYFKKFEAWIFHGYIDDSCKELFIQFADFYQPNTKHFWDKAYTIKRLSVPGFLLGCEELALLCGKYTMLLKAIKPLHPFLSITTPKIEVCFSHQQIDLLQSICKKYVQEAQLLCGASITIQQVYKEKSLKRIEFQQRCAARFQENLEQWQEEQTLKKLKDRSNKEKHRKILEDQIEEIRERKIQKRKESLAHDREYLRQEELLENERLANENLQRQKTLEYYQELGEIVDEQHRRADMKIQLLSKELNEDQKDVETSNELSSTVETTSPVYSDGDHVQPNVIFDEKTDSSAPNSHSIEYELNMKKSTSDYFNSNDIQSEFTTNKIRVLGSTISFNDATILSGEPKVLLSSKENELKSVDQHYSIDNRGRDSNSNELPIPSTDQQRSKAKILQSESNISPIVVKVSKTAESISNIEFQKNQQRGAAHIDIFGNQVIDEFKRNRKKVLTEEFGYTSVDDNKISLNQDHSDITPVDWKPVRTSLSLDFANTNKIHPDIATPMSIGSDTLIIHEDIQDINDSQLKVDIPHEHVSSRRCNTAWGTSERVDVTPDSALNTAGLLNKHGFVFETPLTSTPPHQECYNLTFSFSEGNNRASFFALPSDIDNESVIEEPSNLSDLKNVSTTTITNFLKMSFVLPIHARMSILNNEILKIFLKDLDILGHLKSLRNFYFMMDGEFSSCISDGLITRLECIQNPTELLNFQFLHSILHNALNSSVYGNDQNADRLSFIISDVPLQFDLASPNVLHTLNLSYCIEWPLNLVLTPEAMTHYANIFQHLLKVRRISWVLEQSYQLLKEVAKKSTQSIYASPQYRHVQQIRSKLLSFINALQNHITSTALQASWRAFKIDLEATKSIDDLYHKHARYLKRVKFLCLLNRGSADFFTKLEDVFIVILRFYYQLKQRSWRPNNTHPNFDKFLIIEKDFQKLVKFILRIGSKISRCGYQTEIGDLINIINFNGFYDDVISS